MCGHHCKTLVRWHICVNCLRVCYKVKSFSMMSYLNLLPLIPREVQPDLDYIGECCRRELVRRLTPASISQPLLLTSSSAPTKRRNRGYDKNLGELQQTQRTKRIKSLRAALEEFCKKNKCSLEELFRLFGPKIDSIDLLGTTKAERVTFRQLPGANFCSERQIVQLKYDFAIEFGTETKSFSGQLNNSVTFHGAYMSDPIHFIDVLLSTATEQTIAVGGDFGGGSTKIGMTYLNAEGKKSFAILLIYDARDNYASMNALNDVPMEFTGKTEALNLTAIFDVIQFVIDYYGAFLNGDWLFINTVLGLQSAVAKYPCPICTVSKSELSFNKEFEHREYLSTRDVDPSKSKPNEALIIIDPQRIIPTPLHIYLGIGNRIIKQIYKEMYDIITVNEIMTTVKTKRPISNVGASAVHDLNGPELARWTELKCGENMFEKTAKRNKMNGAYIVLEAWLADLHRYLLTKNEWSEKDKQDWRKIVEQILTDWTRITGDSVFPKLHMLSHTIDMVNTFGFLGRIDEQAMKSAHCEANQLYHHTHRNKSHETAERLRRVLADLVLREIKCTINHQTDYD